MKLKVYAKTVKGNIAVASIEEGLRLLRSPMASAMLKMASKGQMPSSAVGTLRSQVKEINATTIQMKPFVIVELSSEVETEEMRSNMVMIAKRQLLNHPVRATKRDYKLEW